MTLERPLEDLAFDERWLVVDVLVDDAAPLPEINVQYCNPDRPCTYVRGPGALRRWEFMLLPGEEPEAMARDDAVWRLLGAFLERERGRIWRAATYRFHALVAREWRRESVFLLGDAAHQTPPFMGQGLNQGLRDADNLCWKIGAVFHHRMESGVLDTYATERRPMTRAVIEVAKQLGTLICELDRGAAARRDERMLDEMRQGRGEVVRQDLIPSRLDTGFIMRGSDGAPDAGAGHTFPQPWVETSAGRQRLDDLVPAGFLLMARSGWTPAPGDRQTAGRLRVHFATLGAGGPLVQPIREVDGLVARWMSSVGADAALVRPDHFVFGTAVGHDPERQLLNRLSAACAGHGA
jgi:3-(3-hydroxy-phenyl)propionate hydroxylase